MRDSFHFSLYGWDFGSFTTVLHLSFMLALIVPGLLSSTDLLATPELVRPAIALALTAYTAVLATLEHVLYSQHERMPA